MKPKLFTVGITFFATPQMYERVRQIAEERYVSQSEVLREAVSKYFDGLDDETMEKGENISGK